MTADKDDDESKDRGDLGFTFVMKKDGSVVVHHRGKLAATLRGQAAAEFADEVDGADLDSQQQLMARLTGNYKHGNERTAASHPRNRR
jgi:hypothetical protein